ncbi:MAG: RloB domain-containing protein [Rhodopirellula sp.]|mgnify:CR=1 FL=1|nr:RloB domain-containing protein [Rhodopirellula sp.]
MPRKKRPLDRDMGVVRDASLVIIACEDTYAVKQYFARFHTRKVQFHVLATEGGRSSPKDVLARLDAAKNDYATEDGDSFWVCMDTDHWVEANHIRNLRDVLRQCRQKGYEVAISNPCFELWLLLHFEEYTQTTEVPCSDVADALRQAAGSYRKDACDRLAIEPSQVDVAVARAKAMDRGLEDVLPSYPVTRVYRLLELLKERDAIRLL